MTRWKKTVDIKPLIDDKELDDVDAMKAVRDLLAQHPEFEGTSVLDLMDEAIEEGDGDLFNEALDGVYDIADAERIWLGPSFGTDVVPGGQRP